MKLTLIGLFVAVCLTGCWLMAGPGADETPGTADDTPSPARATLIAAQPVATALGFGHWVMLGQGMLVLVEQGIGFFMIRSKA